jgi:hypothetical protein
MQFALAPYTSWLFMRQRSRDQIVIINIGLI